MAPIPKENTSYEADVTYEIRRAINRAHPTDIQRVLVACPREYPPTPRKQSLSCRKRRDMQSQPGDGPIGTLERDVRRNIWQNAPSLSVVTDRVAQYGLTENGQRARATV